MLFDETPSKAVRYVEVLPAELAAHRDQTLLPFISKYKQLFEEAVTE